MPRGKWQFSHVSKTFLTSCSFFSSPVWLTLQFWLLTDCSSHKPGWCAHWDFFLLKALHGSTKAIDPCTHLCHTATRCIPNPTRIHICPVGPLSLESPERYTLPPTLIKDHSLLHKFINQLLSLSSFGGSPEPAEHSPSHQEGHPGAQRFGVFLPVQPHFPALSFVLADSSPGPWVYWRQCHLLPVWIFYHPVSHPCTFACCMSCHPCKVQLLW